MKAMIYVPIPLDKQIELIRLLSDRDAEEMLRFLKDLQREVEKASAG